MNDWTVVWCNHRQHVVSQRAAKLMARKFAKAGPEFLPIVCNNGAPVWVLFDGTFRKVVR